MSSSGGTAAHPVSAGQSNPPSHCRRAEEGRRPLEDDHRESEDDEVNTCRRVWDNKYEKESEKKKAASEGKEAEDSRWSRTWDHHTCVYNEKLGLRTLRISGLIFILLLMDVFSLCAASGFVTSSVFYGVWFGLTFTADAARTLPVAVVPAGPHSRDETVEETHHVLWRTQSCGVLLKHTKHSHLRFWEKNTQEEQSLAVQCVCVLL